MTTNGTNGRGHTISTMAELEALYNDQVYPPAKFKETTRITQAYRELVEASPFFALATIGPDGLDTIALHLAVSKRNLGTIRWLLAKSRSSVRNSRPALTSSPANGSSSTSSSGLCMSAAASSTRCRMPFEYAAIVL